MWSAVSSVVRLFVTAALALVVVAILLGRAVPEEAGFRVTVPDHPVPISRTLAGAQDWQSRYYDPETGRMGRLGLPPNQTLDYASISPWRAGTGQAQVVGLLARYHRNEVGRVLDGATLARLSFPEGRILDEVELDVNLIGPPCWSPDTSARILFPAADGRLYRHDLDARGRSELDRPAPQPLSWKAGSGAAQDGALKDPCWPTDPRFARIVLVALQNQVPQAHAPAPPSEIWWLRLDDDATAIVAAGRVTPPPAPGAKARSEHAPAVATLPDGRTLLAYLSLEPDGTWMLEVVPLQFDRRTGAPRAEAGARRVMGRVARPDAPTFSPDGRWVSCVVGGDGNGPTVLRVAIQELGLEPVDGEPTAPRLAARGGSLVVAAP